MELTNDSLYECLLNNKEVKGDSRFLFDEKTSYSAKDVYDITVNLANKLSSIGIKEGDVVALTTCRSLRCAIVIFALQIIGTHTVMCSSKANANIMDCSWNLANGVVKNRDNEEVMTITLDSEENDKPIFDTNIDTTSPAITLYIDNEAKTFSQHDYLEKVNHLCSIGWFSRSDISLNTNSLFELDGFISLIAALVGEYSAIIPTMDDVDYVAELILINQITRLNGDSEYYNSLARYYEEKGVYPTSLRMGFSDSNDLTYAGDVLGMYIINPDTKQQNA